MEGNRSLFNWAEDDVLAEDTQRTVAPARSRSTQPIKNPNDIDAALGVLKSRDDTMRMNAIRQAVTRDDAVPEREIPRSSRSFPRSEESFGNERPRSTSEQPRINDVPNMNRSPRSAKYEEMRSSSTSGKSTSNTRSKTKTSKKWQYWAVTTGIAISMFAGGKLATPVDDMISDMQNRWELHQATIEFQENVVNKNTTTTFTGDKQIDYEKIANTIEDDGKFTNEELLIAVDALGETNANRVLDASKTTTDGLTVESYMRNNDITSMSDWKNKTAHSMSLEEQLNESQAELDAIFKDIEANSNTYDNGYGGKQ